MGNNNNPSKAPESSTPQAAEYPGLEAIAQRIFDIPFFELSHGLQELVRDSAMRDAAPDMLEALKAGIEIVGRAHQRNSCYCDLCKWSSDAEQIVAKAEGSEL